MFNQGWQDLLPEDQHLISEWTSEGILKLPPSDKYTWLAAFQLAKQQAQQVQHHEQAQQQASLALWLQSGQCHSSSQNVAPSDDDEVEE